MWVALSLLILALGLAMDAFAAALAQGAAVRPGATAAARIGVAFGAAQAVMPLIGWGLGMVFASTIRNIDHWIAFLLLGFLGFRMLREGFGIGANRPARRLMGWALFTAAMATSIDAVAAGVTLPLIGAPILIACAVIGIVTAALSYGGVFLGAAAGVRLGKKAEIAGGLMLIGLGTKILVQHQFFGG